MRADVFANDADAVVYLDSDIIMHRKTAPEDFLENGKPIMEHCSTQHAVAHGVDPRWIRNAAKVIGRPAMVEAMRNSGIIHDTKVVRWCRESVERTTGMDIEEVFKHHWDINTGWFPDRATGVTKPGKPTLSEFITLGAFAWLACPERYSWRDVLQVGYRDIPLTRFWSHSGVTPQIEAQLNALLK